MVPPPVRSVVVVTTCALAAVLAGEVSVRTAYTPAAFAPGSVAQSASEPGGPAGIYNLKIVSDATPDLTDLDSFIRSTTSRWTTPAEKVWALFYWSHILKRQTAPMVLHGLEVTDPIRNFTDFGYTMCSTISGMNQTLYEALGLPHQYWDICNHTVATVEYDGKYRMVDSSMSNLVTTDDGVSLATLQEAAADSARLVRERSLYATSPHGFLSGSDAMRSLPDYTNPTNGGTVSGFAGAFCAGGLKHRDFYYNWDAGHRYVLNLRAGESYTRYYRRLGTSSDYWVGSERISAPDPGSTIEIDAENRFGLRGNGEWRFTPPLDAARWAGAVHSSSNLAPVSAGLGPAVAGQPAEAIYKVQGANAIASQRITARFAKPDPLASAAIAVSTNHGATWADVGSLGSQAGADVPLTIGLRQQVNGAYEVLVRVRMTTDATTADGIALSYLDIATITHLNVKALPQLNVGRNEIVIDAGDQSDTMVLWPDLRAEQWRKDAYDSRNIASQSISVPRKYTAVVYPSVLTQDAYLTYRLDAPTDITRFVYGGRIHNYQSGSYVDYLHSFDGGATWIRSYRLTDTSKPYDVLHYETVTDVPPGVRSVLLKFLIHNTNTTATRATGFYSLRMEANHRPADAGRQPVEVTFRWKEVAADRRLTGRSHRQRISGFPSKYVVNVAGSDHPVMESLKVALATEHDATPAGYDTGTDPGGAKHLYTRRVEGSNLAQGAPYTFSRAPSGFQSSAGAANTRLLTDGVVGAPGTGSFSYWWGQCWASGADVDLQIDLGQPRTMQAIRAHLFGYPGWDALKGQVQDRVEVFTSDDGVTFSSRGVLNTALWRKDIPVNHMLPDDEKATGWNFEQRLAEPVTARYVRYRATPKRTLCVSELQVLDRLVYEPFDLRLALPTTDAGPAAPANQAPGITLTAPVDGTGFTAPATVTLTASAWDLDGTVSLVEFVVDGTVVATDTAAPWSATWTGTAPGRYTLAARAIDDAGASHTSDPVGVDVAPGEPANALPTVVLTAPGHGARFDAPAEIALGADASDADGTIVRVDFYAGAALVGTSSSAPYTVAWRDVPAGSYSLTARAFDERGGTATSATVPIQVGPDAPPGPPADVVLYAADAAVIVGAWTIVADATAAGGARLQNPDSGRAKKTTAAALPTDYFEMTFEAVAGRSYRLWLRGRAVRDSYANDSVFVQFDGSLNPSGAADYRIGTTGAATVILEDCNACGLQGWGWQDNGYGLRALGPLVAFERDGLQRVRIQVREDGLGLDQIVLSSADYVTAAPGLVRGDSTILPPTSAPAPANTPPTVALTAPADGTRFTAPAVIELAAAASDPDGTIARVDFYAGSTLIGSSVSEPHRISWSGVQAGTYTLTARAVDDGGTHATSAAARIVVDPEAGAVQPSTEVVLYAANAPVVAGAWQRTMDAGAAGGMRLQNPDAGRPKLSAPLASPADYFELTFNAEAGRPHRLWIRGRAERNAYANDSVFVQFDGTVTSAGQPINRIGTTAAASIVLEDCSGCGLQGWGWQDTGYGVGVLGAALYFETSGPQRLRIQVREDGLGIDQVVLSAAEFFTSAPGATKDDATVLPERP